MAGQCAIGTNLLRLSTCVLECNAGVLHLISPPGEVDNLVEALCRLRDSCDDVATDIIQPDVAIDIERAKGGSLVVFPAEAV